ncbi:Protein of unknown function DUF829 TMEM53 [Trinorchestia longiramus]|nr:Protein of unknown function DUF829 TMEM53 [Trinorchestia longiramus]
MADDESLKAALSSRPNGELECRGCSMTVEANKRSHTGTMRLNEEQPLHLEGKCLDENCQGNCDRVSSQSFVMEDDFEYFITFPTPKPYIDDLNRKFTPHDVSTNDDKTSSVAENKTGVDVEFPPQITSELDPGDVELCDLLPYLQGSGEKQPVVMMLGWFGARDAYLAKYASIYTARGCICLRYTAPPSSQFFLRTTSYMSPFAEKLVTVLQEMDLHTHPLICHSFSNHGMLAIYYATSGPRWLRMIAAFTSLFFFTAWTVVSSACYFCTGRASRRLPWDLLHEKRRVPQLFLYSDADSLIPSQDVQNFWTHRKQLGVPVYTKRWPDSPHVQHFKYYPEEYTRIVFRFVCECLSRTTVTSTKFS